MKSILHGLAIALAAAAAVAGTVAVAAGPAAAEPPRVVATIPPIHSLVAGVMEGVAEPELLLAGSVSPHHFQLRPSQARMLDRADAIVWVGPGLETALVRSLEALGDARVLALMSVDGVTLLPSRPDGAHGGAHAGAPADPHDDHEKHEEHEEQGHAEDEHAEDRRDADHSADHDEHAADAHDAHAADAHDHAGHDHGPTDPHIWLDPRNAAAMAAGIAALLAEIDPANAGRYRDNAAAMASRLDRLTAEIEASLAPVRRTPSIVFHDAYQYLEHRFGLNVVATVTVDPEIPAGARRMSELRALIENAGVACIFTEPQFQPKLVAALADGTSVRSGVLDPVGADIPPGPALYEALMRRNAEALSECLNPPS